MLEILLGPPWIETTTIGVADEDDDDVSRPVDRVRTSRVYLQPANSRPRHMIAMYERMQGSRSWTLGDETIARSGGRWYINSLFEWRNVQNL